MPTLPLASLFSQSSDATHSTQGIRPFLHKIQPYKTLIKEPYETNTQFLNCSVCKTYKQNETTHSVINNSLASKFFLQAYHQTCLSPHIDSIPTSNPSDPVPPYVIVVSKTLHHPYKILLTQNSPYYFRPFLHVSSTENPQHIIPIKANSILLPSSQCTE